MSDLPDIPDALGKWPILQFLLGAGALLSGFFIWLRGERNKGKDAVPPAAPTQIYLEGPVTKVVGSLEGIYRDGKELREWLRERWQDYQRQKAEELQILRNIYDELRRRPRRE